MNGKMKTDNIFENLPTTTPEELCESLIRRDDLRLERIISTGHSSPPGEWYDQETDEWVMLLQGGAGILFEGESTAIAMRPGDYIHIPAHKRHRVEWTAPDQPTVWLALHYRPDMVNIP